MTSCHLLSNYSSTVTLHSGPVVLHTVRATPCFVYSFAQKTTVTHPPTTIDYKNKNWLQFLFIVKAAVLKQQISKFYPQILSTEDCFYIYERPLTEINVIASFCALNLRIKF